MIITAGEFKGLNIKTPDEKITRPTLSKVRMSIFNTLQSMTNFEGKSFLDMYAGSGIMGLEAISRGFDNVLAIEQHPKVFQVLKQNYTSILKNNNNYKLVKNDSLKYLKKISDTFNIIYIDPPYYSGIYENSLQAIKQIDFDYAILEHVTQINIDGFDLIKQKKYGDKYISFLKLSKTDCINS